MCKEQAERAFIVIVVVFTKQRLDGDRALYSVLFCTEPTEPVITVIVIVVRRAVHRTRVVFDDNYWEVASRASPYCAMLGPTHASVPEVFGQFFGFFLREDGPRF